MSGRGGRGRGKKPAGRGAQTTARAAVPTPQVDPRAAAQAEEAKKRAAEEAARVEREKQERLERERREKATQDSKAREEALRKASEDALRREAEEKRRMLQQAAIQERQRIDEQRKQAEEHLRNQREAILRAEAERTAKMEEMHRQIQLTRQQAVAQIEADKANRERLERLRQEVDNQQMSRVAQKKPVVQRAPVARQPRVAAGSASSEAAFSPQDFLDHEVLSVYTDRGAPDSRYPPVPFTKKGDATYCMGSKRCVVEEGRSGLLVRNESLQEWMEKAERLEGIRLNGLKTATTFVVLQQHGFF